MVNKIVKIAGFVVIILMGLFILTLLFTQTRLFRNWLTNTIEKQVKKNLNAELSIGRIDGNLLQNVRISHVSLMTSGDTLATLASFYLQFDPTKALKKEIHIKVINIDSLDLRLEQFQDATWNFQHLTKPDHTQDTTTVQEPGSFNWTIDFSDFKLSHSNVFLDTSQDLPIPISIKDINTHLSLKYANEKLAVDLKDFRLQTANPELTLKRLGFQSTIQGETVELNNLILQTASSTFTGQALLNPTTPSYKVTLKADPIDLSEITNFLPTWPLTNAPHINLELTQKKNKAQFHIQVKETTQKIDLSGQLTDIKKEPAYNVTCQIDNLNLAQWFDNPDMISNINGVINLSGKGKTPEELTAALQATFSDLAFQKYMVNDLSVNGEYSRGDVTAWTQAATPYGKLLLETDIKDIMTKQKFQLSSTLEKFDLAKLLPEQKLETDINLSLKAKGDGFDIANSQTEIKLTSTNSIIADIPIDSIGTFFTFDKGKFNIHNLDIISPLAQVTAEGAGNLNYIDFLNFILKTNDLTQLNKISKSININGQGEFIGDITGPVNSLETEISTALQNLVYNDIKINALNSHSTLLLEDKDISGDFSLFLRNGKINTLTLDSLRLNSNIQNKNVTSSLQFAIMDSIRGSILANITQDSAVTIHLPQVQLQLGSKNMWNSDDKEMSINLGKDYFTFHNITLVSESQKMTVDGYFSPSLNENISLRLKNIKVGPLISLTTIGAQYPLNGLVNMDIILSGTAEKPTINGSLDFDQISLNKIPQPHFRAILNYKDQVFKSMATLEDSKTGSVKLDASLPVEFSLSKGLLKIDSTQSIDISLTSEGLDLAFTNPYLKKAATIQGKLLADLKIVNTIAEPLFSGFVKTQNVSLQNSVYGINYRDILLNAEINESKAEINPFYIKSKEGELKARASIDFSPGQRLLEDNKIDISVNMNNFLVARGKPMELYINSQLGLSGVLDSLIYSGEIEIPRSRFYIPAFQSVQTNAASKYKPLLVHDVSRHTALDTKKEKADNSDITKKIYGKLKLKIPRNMWIRSKELNTEISGELDIIKNGPTFELFGTIKTLRGTYNIYGKRLEVKEGTVTFKGGDQMNPDVNLISHYTFRDSEGNKSTLTLEATGEALKPNISFAINGTPIEEKDGISYLLFGKSSNGLSRHEKSQVAESGGSSARMSQILTGRVTGQITAFLQKTFNVDVIEFRGGENWRQGAIVVGKYLTNDLYMNYEREFNLGQSHEMIPEKVSLEYEINPHFFLQATKGDDKTTGFDLIWKVVKK